MPCTWHRSWRIIIEREQAAHRRRRLDALSDAARTIVSLRSVDDVLYEICRQATMLLDAEQAGIFLPTDDPNTTPTCWYAL